MAVNRLYISQMKLDEWVEGGAARVASRALYIIDEGRSYDLCPAYRFVGESSETGDPDNLIGRVKDEASMAELGADAYMTSAILGETAYDVEQGFLATLRADDGSQQDADGEGGAVGEEAEEEESSHLEDSMELAAILLKHMT